MKLANHRQEFVIPLGATMPRKKFVAGNWKMNKTAADARSLATGVRTGLGSEDRVTVALCPAFPYLMAVADAVKGSNIAVGAQDIYPEKLGAFTGEVNADMLLDAGCRYVIVGHSERRSVIGEKDDLINLKVRYALEQGLGVIFCVGEKLAERDANKTEAVLDNQLTWGLRNVGGGLLKNLVVAYEPVWAIGTGRTATPEQAQQAHVFIRWRFGQLFDNSAAQSLVIQYGGSVKPENAAELMRQADVDGALVGNASLQAESFLQIVRAALP
jgi:triosephosphate isomerase